jgi:flagellum-specific peptidoglycan hydrolase FlgJ
MAYDQEIYNIAIQEGFTPITAKLIVAQARLESGHYGSDVFKANNNMYGMKFVGQPLATRGTLAPPSERSNSCNQSNVCKDSDHYAKYKSPTDSAKDTIQRLYKITRKGVTFEQLRDSKDADEFAKLLKIRGYYGAIESEYARVLKSILLRVKVVEFYKEYKKPINYGLIGLILVGFSFFTYKYYFKK